MSDDPEAYRDRCTGYMTYKRRRTHRHANANRLKLKSELESTVKLLLTPDKFAKFQQYTLEQQIMSMYLALEGVSVLHDEPNLGWVPHACIRRSTTNIYDLRTYKQDRPTMEVLFTSDQAVQALSSMKEIAVKWMKTVWPQVLI